MMKRTLPPMIAGVLLAAGPAMAQQATGVPGAPDAAQSIPGRVLPAPPPLSGGEINLNAA